MKSNLKVMFLFLIMVILFTGCNNLNLSDKQYLHDFCTDKTYNIRIDCKQDTDCKLVDDRHRYCGEGFSAINVINPDKDWDNYQNERDNETIYCEVDCLDFSNRINDGVFCNERSVCEVKWLEVNNNNNN